MLWVFIKLPEVSAEAVASAVVPYVKVNFSDAFYANLLIPLPAVPRRLKKQSILQPWLSPTHLTRFSPKSSA